MSEDSARREPETDTLLRRFLTEHPDGDLAAFREWLQERSGAEPDRLWMSLAEDALGRLRESEGGAPDFGPPAGATGALDAATAIPEAGRRVGRFLLRRLLGVGGMGQVWEAEDLELDRLVALKLLLPGRVDPGTIERFAREARAGGRLQHPNIVATFDHGQDQGLYWIAQELVPRAWTLADFIERERDRPTRSREYYRAVARLVVSIADALDAAHTAGVLHRDVKPGNVLIGPDGEPRLTDFGLARIDEETTLSVTGDVLGTWAYMSPEQAGGRPGDVSPSSDVFSLGVVLYELLTLRRPFEADSVDQIARRILFEDPAPPASSGSNCPGDLSVICLTALEKSPGRRYPSAGALAEDLRRHLSHAPIHARPPGASGRLLRWTRRHPTQTTALGLGAAALLVTSGLLVRQTRIARALDREVTLRTRLALEAEQAAERARAAESIARAERADVLKLSAIRTAEGLLEEQASLWPPHPERIEDLVDWIGRARSLVRQLPAFRDSLAALDTRDLPGTDEAWWRSQLEHLIALTEKLESEQLEPDAIDPEIGWSVAGRLRFARELEEGFAPGGRYAGMWDAFAPTVGAGASAQPLAPIVGLVPIGRDPHSGLHEFAHLATGSPPERDGDGQLVLTPETGVVLVLLQGGTRPLGVQFDDPEGPNYDSAVGGKPFSRAVHEVTLSPYLISKYELTQSQWERLTGERPSWFTERDDEPLDLTPVDSVSWNQQVAALGRVDLSLPSEMQWEFACRAGTDTPFHFGSDADANGRVNALGATAIATGEQWALKQSTKGHDDGFAYAAPVGSFEPNAFGLHDMHGNVFEFCLDAFRRGPYLDDELAADPLAPPSGSGGRIVRGGSYMVASFATRTFNRISYSLDAASRDVGCRPGRPLGEILDW